MLAKMIGRLNFVLNLIIKFATYLYIINIFHYLCRYKLFDVMIAALPAIMRQVLKFSDKYYDF